MRLTRDIIVAVIGGVIVSLIVGFTTSLSRFQLAEVFAATLMACGLLLGTLQMPGRIRRRRERFKATIVAAVIATLTSTLMDEIAAAVRTKVASKFNSGSSAYSSNVPISKDDLGSILEDGRALQAQLGSLDSMSQPVPSNLAANIARWNARTINYIASERPSRFDNFRSEVHYSDTAAYIYHDLARKLSTIESLIRPYVPEPHLPYSSEGIEGD